MDDATAEWYWKLMSRLKRLDSQRATGGLQMVREGETAAPPPSFVAPVGHGLLPGVVRSSGHRPGLESRRVSLQSDEGGSELGGILGAEDDDLFRYSAPASARQQPEVQSSRLDALSAEVAASEALLESFDAPTLSGRLGGGGRDVAPTSHMPPRPSTTVSAAEEGGGGSGGGMLSDLPRREERRDRRLGGRDAAYRSEELGGGAGSARHALLI